MKTFVAIRGPGGAAAPPGRWAILTLVLLFAVPPAGAAVTGKVGGKIVATDTGDPVGFADVLLVPADTTMHKVGGLTNADGTFLLETAPGRYSLRVRMLSYATKTVEGIVVTAGQLLPFNTAISPEAIQQEEVVVEGKRAQNTETSMLAARSKAASVGDAISAEQVRRSPDRDAAEVLRRVTGLSVADNKYVFVRGLGERYSSTEVDGVRIASPEQNKRVVPLDLVPSNLLDNVVVQKTYTADRPGEFGGGDVQVRTKDFPGHRTWNISIAQGYVQNVTGHERSSYGAYNGDAWGFGAAARQLPSALDGIPALPIGPGNQDQAIALNNLWTPYRSTKALPDGTYSATYGDEVKLFGRSLGIINSWSFNRRFDKTLQSQRFFQSTTDTLYDYGVTTETETAQLGGLAGLSYRLSPAHSIHLRGIYTNTGEDEVRSYVGQDHNRVESTTGQWLTIQDTRLMYVQRDVLSGSLEGNHEFPKWWGAHLDWTLGASKARRQQPDMAEVTYNQRYYFEGDTAHWVLGSLGGREFGELEDHGQGATVKGTLPYRIGGLGSGKAVFGYDRQDKNRENFYRRLRLAVNQSKVIDKIEMPAESIFAEPTFDSGAGWLEDQTFNDPLIGVDNYTAKQQIRAGFLNFDVPMGQKLRGSLGVRVEHGYQNVESFALFNPDSILVKGELDNTDWLPSMNVTYSPNGIYSVRLAASRTLSRPDLNELSPSPNPQYIGGFYVKGNPDLHRAQLDNYDLRVEAFPGLSEVLAAGVFYKKLREPIETVIRGGAPPLLVPENSATGYNRGVELEARLGLGRVWKPLDRFSINSNASFIDSKVTLYPRVTQTGSTEHPLQGQASYLFNVGLGYAVPDRWDAALLFNAVGRRLRTLAYQPLPDIYEEPYTQLDASFSRRLYRRARLKATARNLLDPQQRWLQGHREVSAYHTGRTFTLAINAGS